MKINRRLVAIVFATLALPGYRALVGQDVHSPADSSVNVSPNPPAKPNIIVVMADDLDLNSMNAALAAGYMPNVKRFLIDAGMTFQNFFASDALCCPSRATFFTGQYPHNHGVTDNAAPWDVVALKDANTLPVWLKRAGYRTGLIGKYLNRYGLEDMNKDGRVDAADAVYIPPGWDDWEVMYKGYTEYGYSLSVNGAIISYGQNASDYQTDVLRAKGCSFIKDSTTPFFLEVTPTAPHVELTSANWPPASYADLWKFDIRPAPRHAGTVNLPLPQGPAFNEADLSGKAWINPVNIPRLTAADIGNLQVQYNDRIASIRAIDDLVVGLLQAVKNKGVWNNTIFVFTSDNGYLLGEHRLYGKEAVYEEAIRIPLYIRKLWETTAQVSDAYVTMNDMAPTFAEFGGVAPGLAVDGTSFSLLLTNPLAPWRLRLGVEHWDHTSPAGTFYIPEYHGVRASVYDIANPNMLYVGYTQGSVEVYDLQVDPYQMQNLQLDTSGTRVAQLQLLQAKATALRGCSGPTCHDLEFH